MTTVTFDETDYLMYQIGVAWGQPTDRFTDDEITQITRAQELFFAWQAIIRNRLDPDPGDAFLEADVARAKATIEANT